MIREFVLTALGLILVLTPLAIWAAWTEAIYYGLLAGWGAAFCLYQLVDAHTGPADGPPGR